MGDRDSHVTRRFTDSWGVAILFRKGVDCVIHTKILDPFGRYIILKAAINCNDKIYILINAYIPNKDKDITFFFQKLIDNDAN